MNKKDIKLTKKWLTNNKVYKKEGINIKYIYI